MEKIRVFLFSFLMFTAAALSAQETYIIEGDTLQLTREVRGPLSLFWNETGNKFRYFVQKKDRMVELFEEPVGTKPGFREQLEELTDDAVIKTHEVKFVLYSLRHFVNSYNALIEEDYLFNDATADIQKRIGLFVGLSNNIYTENRNNVLAPVVGGEFEFFDPNLAPRHAAFVHLRHSFSQDEYHYNSTQLSLNYRFRALYFDGFDLHIDAELATFLYSEGQLDVYNDAGEIVAIKEETGFSFTAPFSFGIGSDIQITENGFITLSYNDIFSLVLDGNGNFPVDFTVGYKYSL